MGRVACAQHGLQFGMLVCKHLHTAIAAQQLVPYRSADLPGLPELGTIWICRACAVAHAGIADDAELARFQDRLTIACAPCAHSWRRDVDAPPAPWRQHVIPVPWPRDVIARMELPEDDAAYLSEVGLVSTSDSHLSVTPPAGADQPAFHDGLPVVAHDHEVPICVQNGDVILMEPTGTRLVNASLAQFGAFVAIYEEYRARVRGYNEDDAQRLIEEIEARMSATDPAAMASPERYWPLIVEQMHHGLL